MSGYLGEEVIVTRATGKAGDEEGEDIGTALAEEFS